MHKKNYLDMMGSYSNDDENLELLDDVKMMYKDETNLNRGSKFTNHVLSVFLLVW